MPQPTIDATLHPKFAPLFDPQYTFVILRGGRASMKSWACARAALLQAATAGRKERILFCRELQNSISESVHKLLSDQIEALHLGRFYKVQRDGIDGINGSEMFFKGLRNDPQAVKGIERLTLAWVEEAQSVSQESLDTLIPTVLRNPGARIWFTYNPRFADDPIHLMAENPPPGTAVIDVNYRDAVEMGVFAPALLVQMAHMRQTQPMMYDHIWEGKIVPNLSTSLWSEADIAQNRVPPSVDLPTLARVVVAIDPAVTANKHSDETGIIVAGCTRPSDNTPRRFFVMKNLTKKLSPEGWARRALDAYDTYEADCIVAEVNQGGDMVEETLRNVCVAQGRPVPKIKLVRATRGKAVRAEPIASLYSQGLVSHVGHLPELEREMLTFDPLRPNQKSPNAMDALVWALAELSGSKAPLKLAESAVQTLTQRRPSAPGQVGRIPASNAPPRGNLTRRY